MGFDGTLRINGDVPLMKALQTAANLEVGTRKTNAQPFMKPAFDVVQPGFIADLRRAGIVK